MLWVSRLIDFSFLKKKKETERTFQRSFSGWRLQCLRQGAFGALHLNICCCIADKKEVDGGFCDSLSPLPFFSFYLSIIIVG